MSLTGINFLRTASVLGYCLLPLVLTSAIGVGLSLEYVLYQIILIFSGFIGYSLTAGILLFVVISQ